MVHDIRNLGNNRVVMNNFNKIQECLCISMFVYDHDFIDTSC